MSTTLDENLDALALDATRAGLRTADPDAGAALLALARSLTTLAGQAREGRMLITTRGAALGPEPMREPQPARLSGATPGLIGDERLFVRERGGRA
jgi:hypothetical protein